MEDKVVRIFKALACRNRIEILRILSRGKKCLCEIAKDFDLDMSTLSRHVGELVRLGILKEEKRGNKKYLDIADPRILKVIDLAESIARNERG